MNVIGWAFALIGFFFIAGTAGSSDFYEACRVAADCNASPMSGTQMMVQLMGGLLLLTVGGLILSGRK